VDSEGHVTLFLEDFDVRDLSWSWWIHNTGSGTVRNGYAFLNITDKSVKEQPSRAGVSQLKWSQLHYRGIPTKPTPLPDAEGWLYVSMEVRLRCSDDNKLQSDVGGGLRFWGLVEDLANPDNYLLFNSWSREAGPESAGFSAKSVVNDNTALREPITGIDMTEWHIYTITWEPDYATFLVDGQLVSTTNTTPNVPMYFDIYLENLLPKGRMDMEHNVSVQVDYVRLFTIGERYQDWSEDISGLFSTAEEMINEAEKKGINTTTLKKDYYDNAKDIWREDYHNHFGAKTYLEKIITTLEVVLEHWDEIMDMFSQANATIEEAQLGADTRTINMMKGYYSQAERKWKEYDTENTKTYLQKILDMPEPALLSILGLILLPALLRKHAGLTN
jgi:hypothetical protein